MPRDRDRSKFVELAEKRVTRVIKDIRLIGNLSNRSNYDYAHEDVKKIVKAVQNALNEMKARFDRKGDPADVTFKL